MRNRTVVVCGLAAIFIFSGCSSTSDEASKPKTTNSTTANTAAVNAGNEIASSQPADANLATTNQAVAAADRMDSRLQEMRRAGAASSGADPAASAMKNAQPAPDNSTFTSYLTDAGYEIRTFNDHPQLLKAEKKVTSDGKQSLKIYLRDGKIVEAPANKVPVLATAPAALLLEAAGVRQPAAPVKGPIPSSQGQKKSG